MPQPVSEKQKATAVPIDQLNRHASDIRISPAAAFAAANAGLRTSDLMGTGPKGRNILRDIEDYIHRNDTSTYSQKTTHPVVGRRGISQIIQAWPTRPSLAQANLSANCRIDALLEARRSLNADLRANTSDTHDVSLSALFVKALALALRDVPAANVILTGDRLIRQSHCDVAFARSSSDGRVDFPTIDDGDRKSVLDISCDLHGLLSPADKVTPKDSEGGNETRRPTAAIANIGKGAISRYQTPLYQSHATVLAIPSAEPRLVPPTNAEPGSDEITIQDWQVATVLEVTLGCDTRMMSGVIAAELLEAFVQKLQEPSLLIGRALK